MVYSLPSSFAGGMQGAVESLKKGTLPQSSMPNAPLITQEQKTFLPQKPQPVQPIQPTKSDTRPPMTKAEKIRRAEIMVKAGATQDEIQKYVSQFKTSDLQEAPAPEKQPTYINQDVNQSLKQGNLNAFLGGAIGGITKGIGNIGEFVAKTGDKFVPGQPFRQWGEDFAESGRGTADIIQKKMGVDPNRTMTKVGEFAGEMGLGYGVGGTLVKGASMIPKVGTVAQKAPFLTKVAKGATEGLGFDVASQGEAGIGTVIGGALPIAGAGLSKGVQYFTKKLPTSLQLQGLMNQAKVTLLKKQLQTEGTTAPDDVAKWMIDRNIKGTKEDIIQNLITRAEQSKQAVDDSLSAIQKTFSSPTAKQALQQSYDDLVKVAGLEDEAQAALTLLGKKQYTLTELNQIKRILDRQYNLYTKTGDPTAGLKAQGLQKIRANLRSTIENEAEKLGIKNIRALNNETQVARTMADSIARKDSADAVREALTAFAPSGIGAVIGGFSGPFDRGTLAGNVGNILFGMLAGRVVGSTKLKTNVASFLSKLSKKEISALDAYLKAGGKSALPLQILEKLDDTIKLLPPASGLPTSAKVVDVQPMTGFLPGVMQKQSEAISSKVGTQPGTKSILQSLSKSPVNSEKGILPKPQQKKVNIPGKKVNTPIIKKTEVKAKLPMKETPKTPQAKALSSKSEVKYSKPIEDNLVKEARKYKSAEEFVKAQGEPVYHGGNVARETFDIAKAGSKEQGHNAKAGFWFAKDINTAKGYGKNVTEIFPEKSLKNPKIVDADGETFGDMRDIIDDAIAEAKKNGNDGVIFKNLSDEKDWGNYNPTDHYVIFNPESIITKKKLLDTYNKANKK